MTTTQRDIQDELRRIEASLGGGTLGVCASVGHDGEPVTYNADETFPTASVIKVAIVAEWFARVEEGDLSADETVTVAAADHIVGSGVLAGLRPGHTFALPELAWLAITVSDNTASNLVLRVVGGKDRVNTRMRDEWGMRSTVIHRPIRFHVASGDPPYTATGTPRDLCRFMELAATGRLHSSSVSAQVLTLLAHTDNTEMLPRYLDVNHYADDLDAAAPPVLAFHKPGAVTGVRNDAGIIRRGGETSGGLCVAVYTKGCPDARWTAANQGSEAVARVGELLARRLLE